MYKRRYLPVKLRKATKEFNEAEAIAEDHNVKALTKEVKKIIKHDEPLEKMHKKIKKKGETKPINTRILLKGFI